MKLLFALGVFALFCASMHAFPFVETEFPTEKDLPQSNGKIWKKRPEICRQYDCPVYELEEKTNKYEIRSYNSARWLSFEADGFFTKSVLKGAYQTLLGYSRSAQNYQQKHFPVTLPYVTRFRDLDASWVYIEALAYMPESFGATLPRPANPEITVKSWPRKLRVFVRPFHANIISIWQIRRQRDLLFWELDRKFLKYVKSSVSMAGYNKPKFWDWSERHYHEIWVRAV